MIPQLFGGYDMLHDPTGLCFWNPFWLVLSPLALTPWKTALVDCYAALQLLVGTFVMAHLLVRVRALFRPELTDGRIAFLTASYIFSIWMIVITPNWVMFLANQAALPLFFLGFWHEKRLTGICLVTCAFFESIVVGHLNSSVFCLLFLTFWILVQFASSAGEARESGPAVAGAKETGLRFFWGGTLAGLCLAPLLYMALSGFVGMGRFNSESAQFVRTLAIPAPVFFASYFSGLFAAFFGAFSIYFVPDGFSSAIILTPASYWIFHSLGARRKLSPIEMSCVATAGLVALCVIRPPWLANIFSVLPFLRSTRLPFREVFAFLFFVHLWIALRPVAVSPLLVRLTTIVGVLFYTLSIVIFRPPTFTPMALDRYLILSGGAEAYWQKIRPIIARGKGLLIPVVKSRPWVPDRSWVPWTLMNAYSYPALSDLKSRSGYTIINMKGSGYAGAETFGPLGCYYTKDLPLLRAADPTNRFFVLQSVSPVRIELWDGAKRIPLPVPKLPRVSPNRIDLEPR